MIKKFKNRSPDQQNFDANITYHIVFLDTFAHEKFEKMYIVVLMIKFFEGKFCYCELGVKVVLNVLQEKG